MRYNSASGIAASPDGSAVFVTGEAGTLALNPVTGATMWQDHYKRRWMRYPDHLAVSPDSSKVFVLSPGGTRIGVREPFLTTAYDAATGAQLWAARYTGPANRAFAPVAIAASPDGTRVFITGSVFKPNGTERFETLAYDAATGAQLWAASYLGPTNADTIPEALAVSPDGSKVFVTGFTTGTGVTYYDTVGYDASTGGQLWQAHLVGLTNGFTVPASITVSRDSTRVYVTGSSASGPIGGPSEYLTVAYRA